MQAWYRDLIRLRRSTPSLNDGEPGNARVTFDEASGWLILERGHVRVHCNLGQRDHEFPAAAGCRIVLASRAGIEIRNFAIILPPDSVAICSDALSI
jgi:maltooligosyltrehalose trehalohydrolase